MKTLSILRQKKLVHLADHVRSNVTANGLKLLSEFTNSYLKGNCSAIIVTSGRVCKQYRDGVTSKVVPKCEWARVRVMSPKAALAHTSIPDILWVDDVTLPQDMVDQLIGRFAHKGCHVILSGKKPTKLSMRVVVDTREQKPLWGQKDSKRVTMSCGDYTTEKLFNVFHIERKSLEDLYGTITKGHIRFRKEQLRAVASCIELVLYVEGSKKDFAAKRFKRGHERKITGATLVKIIDSISSRWPLEVVWCGSRLKAKRMILDRLKKEERKLK